MCVFVLPAIAAVMSSIGSAVGAIGTAFTASSMAVGAGMGIGTAATSAAAVAGGGLMGTIGGAVGAAYGAVGGLSGLAAIGSAGMSAYGAVAQAQQQQAAYKYQAAVESDNQIIARRQAQDALRRGEMSASMQMLKNADLRSKQAAALSASGVDIGSGSAQDLLATSDFLGKKDVNTIMSNSAREAWGYDVQAGNAGANAGLLNNTASNISPAVSGATSLLGSANQFADRWYYGNKLKAA